jgi:N-acetylmuramoyl-L-alanine amidase
MKKLLPLMAIISSTILLISFKPSSTTPLKPIRTIVIDAGHGGTFAGAKGMFSHEEDVALQVAMKLGKKIQQEFPEIKIVYTRTSDNNAGGKNTLVEDLRYRANVANESGGDLFISIHCNSAGKTPGGWYGKRITGYTSETKRVKVKKKWVTKKVKVPIYETYWIENLPHGTETYVWAVNKNGSKIDAVARNNEYYGEMDSTNAELTLPDPSDPAEKARMLIYAQNYFRKSLTLADLIEKEFVNQGRLSRGVKQRNDRGIWVLQATGMPSVLVEIGFITNKDEEIYINSEKGQEEIVSGIVKAFRTYKEKIEQKSDGLTTQ